MLISMHIFDDEGQLFVVAVSSIVAFTVTANCPVLGIASVAKVDIV